MAGHDAIIIGAGHNGLVAAAYLGRAGMRVLVLERRAIVGGACVTEKVMPGHRVSSCAWFRLDADAEGDPRSRPRAPRPGG